MAYPTTLLRLGVLFDAENGEVSVSLPVPWLGLTVVVTAPELAKAGAGEFPRRTFEVAVPLSTSPTLEVVRGRRRMSFPLGDMLFGVPVIERLPRGTGSLTLQLPEKHYTAEVTVTEEVLRRPRSPLPTSRTVIDFNFTEDPIPMPGKDGDEPLTQYVHTSAGEPTRALVLRACEDVTAKLCEERVRMRGTAVMAPRAVAHGVVEDE